MSIEKRGEEIFIRGGVKQDSERFFTVQSKSGKDYDIFMGPKGPSCTCLWWVYGKGKCSHIHACERFIDEKSKVAN